MVKWRFYSSSSLFLALTELLDDYVERTVFPVLAKYTGNVTVQLGKRLRTGSAPLQNTWDFYSTCGVETDLEKVEHLFLNCPLFSHARSVILDNLCTISMFKIPLFSSYSISISISIYFAIRCTLSIKLSMEYMINKMYILSKLKYNLDRVTLRRL